MEGRGRAFAYVYLPGHLTLGRAMELRREVLTYAIVQGLSIAWWFVDERTTCGTALVSMVRGLRAGAAQHVVVPESAHLQRHVLAGGWALAEILSARPEVQVHAVHDAMAARDENGLRRRAG